jgi:hypothetical protein
MPSFPVSIAFRILTIHPQMLVREGGGAVLGYVQQSLWRFKEAVTVYADESKAQAIYKIDADRVIDFNANYAITQADGTRLGEVRRHGLRSLWRASYDIVGPQAAGSAFHVSEKSALVRFIDGLIGEIPVIGLLTGLFLQPIYYAAREDGTRVLTMTKQRSLLEAHFEITQDAALDDAERERLLLGLMMIILLERSRG